VLDAEKMGFEIPTDTSEDALRQDWICHTVG
jgi:hypothetical protein